MHRAQTHLQPELCTERQCIVCPSSVLEKKGEGETCPLLLDLRPPRMVTSERKPFNRSRVRHCVSLAISEQSPTYLRSTLDCCMTTSSLHGSLGSCQGRGKGEIRRPHLRPSPPRSRSQPSGILRTPRLPYSAVLLLCTTHDSVAQKLTQSIQRTVTSAQSYNQKALRTPDPSSAVFSSHIVSFS